LWPCISGQSPDQPEYLFLYWLEHVLTCSWKAIVKGRGSVRPCRCWYGRRWGQVSPHPGSCRRLTRSNTASGTSHFRV